MFQHVPPQYPTTVFSGIAIVGEAPSDEECYKGRPFVGPSGRLLNAMLRSANIDRDSLLITNVFDEQIPDNDIDKSGWLKDDVRISENFARLKAELGKPSVIVPMGNTALWAFTSAKNISLYRGAVTQASRILPGAKLLPTCHPAAIIRNWQSLSLGVADLMKAVTEAAKGPGIVYPAVDLYIDPTVEDVEAFSRKCMESDKVAVDIETGWGQITAISLAPDERTAMSIPFIDMRSNNKSYWASVEDEVRVWRALIELMENDVPKVGQNFSYDFFWLWQQRCAVHNYRYDTRLRHKVLFPELPADLATMGANYTDLGSWKWRGGRYQKEEKADA